MTFQQAVIGALTFSFIGVVVFVVSFAILDRITPYRLWSEIVEKQNQALAIFVGACAIALGLIISGAIHG
ncbi:MAG: DUF350 domain-containing protein [Proteobacteria bacterium]|nr:DUF350 domain-containing protein [Pseudomonadota bacterium]